MNQNESIEDLFDDSDKNIDLSGYPLIKLSDVSSVSNKLLKSLLEVNIYSNF